MADDPRDSMGKRLEEAIRDLMLLPGSSGGDDPLDEIRVWFRGDPFMVPVRLYPFGAVGITLAAESTGERGFSDDTGPTKYYRYDGWVSIEVVHRDAAEMGGIVDRKMDVPSHDMAHAFAAAAHDRIKAWGPTPNDLSGAVTSEDGKETSQTLTLDAIHFGLNQRPDNITNLGSFEFHIFTKREEYA